MHSCMYQMAYVYAHGSLRRGSLKYSKRMVKQKILKWKKKESKGTKKKKRKDILVPCTSTTWGYDASLFATVGLLPRLLTPYGYRTPLFSLFGLKYVNLLCRNDVANSYTSQMIVRRTFTSLYSSLRTLNIFYTTYYIQIYVTDGKNKLKKKTELSHSNPLESKIKILHALRLLTSTSRNKLSFSNEIYKRTTNCDFERLLLASPFWKNGTKNHFFFFF